MRVFLSVLSVLLSFAVLNFSRDDELYEPSLCQFQIPTGQRVECGYVRVPEDHANPDGESIRLHVAIFRSRSDNPAPDPIVYLEGGPGADALAPVHLSFNLYFAHFLADRDFIMFDQRGTGYSEPSLKCAELHDTALMTLSQSISAAESGALNLDAVERCHTRLLSQGIDLSLYNTAQNAADLEAIRTALGYEQWNLYGISYGTRLALTAMRDYPNGIRSVILDSPYPLDENLYLSLAPNLQRALNVLFAGCAAHRACQQSYPYLETDFYALVDQLNQQPVHFKITHPMTMTIYDYVLDGDGLVSFMYQMLYSSQIIPLLPRIIYEVRDGEYDTISLITGYLVADKAFISHGMYFSVQCREEVSFTDDHTISNSFSQYPQLLGMFQRTPNLTPSITPICQIWNAGRAAAVENLPVESSIPTLILSGEYDPITPPQWGEKIHQSLSNGYFYTFPGLGHGVSVSGACPISISRTFLNTPTNEPNTNCLNALQGPQFAIPAQQINMIPSDDLGFDTLIPEGWNRLAPGIYTRPPLYDAIYSQQVFIDRTPAEILSKVMRQFSVENMPVEQETWQTNGLVWTIYRFETAEGIVDFALASVGDFTYTVMLTSPAEEHTVLYNQVFERSVNTLLPR